MNISLIVQAFLNTMQQLQPGIEATLTAGSAIKTVGTVVRHCAAKGKTTSHIPSAQKGCAKVCSGY